MPDGWQDLRSSISPNFECQENGYFADVDNELVDLSSLFCSYGDLSLPRCQLFHVCQFIQLPFSKAVSLWTNFKDKFDWVFCPLLAIPSLLVHLRQRNRFQSVDSDLYSGEPAISSVSVIAPTVLHE